MCRRSTHQTASIFGCQQYPTRDTSNHHHDCRTRMSNRPTKRPGGQRNQAEYCRRSVQRISLRRNHLLLDTLKEGHHLLLDTLEEGLLFLRPARSQSPPSGYVRPRRISYRAHGRASYTTSCTRATRRIQTSSRNWRSFPTIACTATMSACVASNRLNVTRSAERRPPMMMPTPADIHHRNGSHSTSLRNGERGQCQRRLP